MKKTIIYSVLFAILAFALVSCDSGGGGGPAPDPDPTDPIVVPVTGLELSRTSMTVKLDAEDPDLLTANVFPTNATNKNTTWDVSPADIISLGGTGNTRTITGEAAGTATITVKTANGEFSATCKVTVPSETALVTSVTVTGSVSNLFEDSDPVQLTAVVLPAENAPDGVTWSSSKDDVATISSSGLLTPVAPGTTTITATSKAPPYLSGTLTVTIKVKTTPSGPTGPTAGDKDVTGIFLFGDDPADGIEKDVAIFNLNTTPTPANDGETRATAFKVGSVAKGNTIKLTYGISPVDLAKSYKVIWTPENPTYAIVESSNDQGVTIKGLVEDTTAMFSVHSESNPDVKVYFTVDVKKPIATTNITLIDTVDFPLPDEWTSFNTATSPDFPGQDSTDYMTLGLAKAKVGGIAKDTDTALLHLKLEGPGGGIPTDLTVHAFTTVPSDKQSHFKVETVKTNHTTGEVDVKITALKGTGDFNDTTIGEKSLMKITFTCNTPGPKEDFYLRILEPFSTKATDNKITLSNDNGTGPDLKINNDGSPMEIEAAIDGIHESNVMKFDWTITSTSTPSYFSDLEFDGGVTTGNPVNVKYLGSVAPPNFYTVDELKLTAKATDYFGNTKEGSTGKIYPVVPTP